MRPNAPSRPKGNGITERHTPTLSPLRTKAFPLTRQSLQTDPQKLLPINRPVPIQIKLLNHRRQLLLLQPLPQLPRHPSQIAQIDLPLPPLIEQFKRPQNLLSRIPREDALRHYGLELREREEKAGIAVGVLLVGCGGRGGRRRGGRGAVGLEDGEDFGFGEVEAEGFHGDFEFVVVDFVVLVQVEEVELR